MYHSRTGGLRNASVIKDAVKNLEGGCRRLEDHRRAEGVVNDNDNCTSKDNAEPQSTIMAGWSMRSDVRRDFS